VHHCFRAIPHANAVAFQSRLKAAMTAAGIDMALQFRHLFVIRRDATPGGPKTKQLCKDFNDAGGMFVSLTDEDLKTILALQALLKERPDGFEAWLKERKPLCDILLFREAGLCGPTDSLARPDTLSPTQDDTAARPIRKVPLADPKKLQPPKRQSRCQYR
jgi:hypothetical protein